MRRAPRRHPIRASRHEFFFTTPEQLARPELRQRLTAAHVDLFVIDEAHCPSQWGHDFRPD